MQPATAALMASTDWAATALGPRAQWPALLRSSADLVIQSPVAMVLMWGPAHVMIYNDRYAELAAEKHPRAFGGTVQGIWPEIWAWNRAMLERGFRDESFSALAQELILERNGAPESTWMDLYYTPVRDDEGRVHGVLCTVVEITARVSAERALRDRAAEETAFLRSLFEQAPSFIAVLRGPRHVFELTNASYQRLINHRDVIGKPLGEALPEVVEQGFIALLDRVYREGEPYFGRNSRVALATGTPGEFEERVLEFIYQPIRGVDGNVAGVFVEGTDVTDRMSSEERLRVAQRAGGIGTFEWHPESGRMDVSEEYRKLWGLAPDTPVTDKLLVSLVHPDDRSETGPSRLQGSDNPLGYAEYRITRPDTNEVRWLARRGEVVGGGTTGRRFVGVSFDITERKRIETDLREANERLHLLLNQAAVGIYQTDLDGVIIQVNDLFCTMTGRLRSQLLGMNRLDLVHPEDRPQTLQHLQRLRETREPFFVEKRYLRPDGSVLWVSNHVSLAIDSRAQPRYVSTIVTDVTERRRAVAALHELNETLETRVREEVESRTRAEEALRQSQKMEAVGQLTGGIAHDFNNLLQGILMSVDLSQQLLLRGRGDEIGRFLDTARASAKRAAALTHRLLAFSRRQPLDPKPLDANQLVKSMEDLLRRSLGAAIEFELVLGGGLWITRCDRNQLENAILNLAINARDAMPDGGKLVIETGNTVLSPDYAAAQQEVAPGQYVCICVTDTGTGMPPDVVQRAFDPFFTTKPMGQGTGLGLSMIYGFVRQSEGSAKIYSELGRGTSVKLYLPRFRGPVAPEEQEAVGEAESSSPQGDVVLVVEDEAAIRLLICNLLEDLGFRVLSAVDGPGALRVLETAGHIDLLVTDIGLPVLNGRQVADAARAQRPSLPVLFMTGYAENAALSSGFLDPGMHLLTKPFATDLFLARVRDILNKRAG